MAAESNSGVISDVSQTDSGGGGKNSPIEPYPGQVVEYP